MYEKNADRIHAEIVLIDANHFDHRYYYKILTNERTNNRILDITFEENDSFLKLIIIFEIFNRLLERAMQNLTFDYSKNS